MTEAEAFLRQATHDFRLFKCLYSDPRHGGESVPDCYLLHYLQMATEKLSKALLIPRGLYRRKVHDTFSTLLQRLKDAGDELAFALGWADRQQFVDHVTHIEAWCCDVERFNPAVQDHAQVEGGRNVEYPWADDGSWVAPVDHDFGEWGLRSTGYSVHATEVVDLVGRLLDFYDEVVDHIPSPRR